MNQSCSTTPEVSLCTSILQNSEKNTIKKSLMSAYAYHDIDLGDEVIPAGEKIEIVEHFEGSVYIARRHSTIFAVSDRNEVRVYIEKRKGEK